MNYTDCTPLFEADKGHYGDPWPRRGNALDFFVSVFVLLGQIPYQVQSGERGQITVFFSSHFAFMSDRGRLAVLSLYRLGDAGDH